MEKIVKLKYNKGKIGIFKFCTGKGFISLLILIEGV